MLSQISLAYLLNLSTNDYIAVVANGQFPTSPEIIALIKNSTSIIACDGAGSRLNKRGIIPDYIVGDNDSATHSAAQAKNPYIYIADQNCNDLTKAINFVKANFAPEVNIIIFAANGLREDHALANLALFAQYGEHFANIFMLSDYGIFSVHSTGTHKLTTYPKQQISLFSFNPQNQVSCHQLKWPLVDFSFDYLNSGTLNQATDKQINFNNSAQLIVYRSFDIKNQ